LSCIHLGFRNALRGWGHWCPRRCKQCAQGGVGRAEKWIHGKLSV